MDPGGARIWVIIWTPGVGIHVGWVDPLSGEITQLGVVGSGPQPRPANENWGAARVAVRHRKVADGGLFR